MHSCIPACISFSAMDSVFRPWILKNSVGGARGGSMKAAENVRSPTPGQLSCVIAICIWVSSSDFWCLFSHVMLVYAT